MQVDILGLLVLRGKLTKGMAESLLKRRRHGDILYAFDKLEEKGFIIKGGSKFGRGNKQYYYNITENGLVLLITIEPIHPLKFWKAMLGYFHHYGNSKDDDKIQRYSEIFLERYLKYRGHGFSSYLDTFHIVTNNWFQRYVVKRKNHTNNGVGPQQKVLEVLAAYPGITLKELVERTGERESAIKKALSIYTLESYGPVISTEFYIIYKNMTGKKHSDTEEYSEFLLHNVVTVKKNNEGIKTYGLSLFGVILVLTLIYRLGKTNATEELFYGSTFSSSVYVSKIATNYKDRLPLIFGKWDLVTDILKMFAFYNFDVIVDKDISSRGPDNTSITRGGNKEIYDGIREIILQRRHQLEYFADAGNVVWFNYLTGSSGKDDESATDQGGDYLINGKIPVILDKSKKEENLDKVRAVYKLLAAALLILNPIEFLFSRSESFHNIQLRDTVEEISNAVENSFADEITSLYYMNLWNDSNIRLSHYRKQESFYVTRCTPKECLSLILKRDKKEPLIREWFSRWMKDLVSYQQQIVQNLEVVSHLA